MRTIYRPIASALASCIFASTAAALLCLTGFPAQAQERPPAVPLLAHDPYFSIWSMADHLTDEDTRHWTGAPQPFHGLVRIDGKIYRLMGTEPKDAPAMHQTSLIVAPTHTAYEFEDAGVRIGMTFFTPALPHDLDALSRPVTYLTWEVSAADGKSHQAALFLSVDPRVAVNTPDQEVTWSRSRTQGLEVLSAGSRDQRVLNRSGDNLRIDWGYFRLGVPDGPNATLALSPDAMQSFAETGELPSADELEMPQQPRAGAADLAVILPIAFSGSETVSRRVLLAYTERYAIEYLERKLRPYWQRNGETPEAMLSQAEKDYPELEKRGRQFDQRTHQRSEKVGGKAYAQLATLAYRQTLAAHGFAADVDGTPHVLPEGELQQRLHLHCGRPLSVCAVLPASSTRLFEAQLKPVLEYSALPRWKWPFAPHDLGTYPLANGQVYGGGERTEEDQMPVEESGNMLIMMAALGQEEGNWDLAQQYWPQLTKWAEYLLAKGSRPRKPAQH